MNEAVMREMVGDRTVNEVVTVGRQEVASAVQVRLQALTDQYQMGITIDQVVLQDVTRPTRSGIRGTTSARLSSRPLRQINEAERDYNAVIPRARGEAEQTVLQARGTRWDRVNRPRVRRRGSPRSRRPIAWRPR